MRSGNDTLFAWPVMALLVIILGIELVNLRTTQTNQRILKAIQRGTMPATHKSPMPPKGQDSALRRPQGYYSTVLASHVGICQEVCRDQCETHGKGAEALQQCEQACGVYYARPDETQTRQALRTMQSVCVN